MISFSDSANMTESYLDRSLENQLSDHLEHVRSLLLELFTESDYKIVDRPACHYVMIIINLCFTHDKIMCRSLYYLDQKMTIIEVCIHQLSLCFAP
jgi:hypothetical protein